MLQAHIPAPPHAHVLRCLVQILFPESYERTAAWLREQAVANADVLAACKRRLAAAVESHPRFSQLASGLEVREPRPMQAHCCQHVFEMHKHDHDAATPLHSKLGPPLSNSCTLPLLPQVHGRTKTLFSTLKKLLRLGNTAAGGRARAQVHQCSPLCLPVHCVACAGWCCHSPSRAAVLRRHSHCLLIPCCACCACCAAVRPDGPASHCAAPRRPAGGELRLGLGALAC